MRDLERSALEKVFSALNTLDEEGRARVLAWINDHFRYAQTGTSVPLSRPGDGPGSRESP